MFTHHSPAGKHRLRNLTCALLATAGLLAPAIPARAAGWKATNIYTLNGNNGHDSQGGLIVDAQGNLYGTAASGGSNDRGVVFKLTPPAPGQTAWTKTTLLKFSNAVDAAGNDLGATPRSTLAMDKAGNLYGIATVGGGNSKVTPAKTGYGLIFKLTPPKAGQTKWTESGAYYFRGTLRPYEWDGMYADAAGNLYGTGYVLNPNPTLTGNGVIYKFTPAAKPNAQGTVSVIAKFLPSGKESVVVFAHSILFDKAGNMLGVTRASNQGVSSIFKLFAPTAPGGAWTKSTLDVPNDPADPSTTLSYVTGLAITPGGSVYGLGALGAFQQAAFSLTVPAPGQSDWAIGDIYKMDFGGNWVGMVSLASDTKGNLFSIATNYDYFDAVFYQLTPPAGGSSWAKTALSKALGADRNYNSAPIVFDTKGNMFGVLNDGGPHQNGAVIELSPK